jgi:hypothetical protein
MGLCLAHSGISSAPWWFVENESVVSGTSPKTLNKPKTKRSRWLWPVGLMATGMAGVAVLFRGCWHRRMSWPVRSAGHSYQVCLGCGAKRLFDEDAFQSYGPYSYELQRLVTWDDERRSKTQAEVARVQAAEQADATAHAEAAAQAVARAEHRSAS